MTQAIYLNEAGDLKKLLILLSFDNKTVNMALVFDFADFPDIASERYAQLDNFPIPLTAPFTVFPVAILYVSPEVYFKGQLENVIGRHYEMYLKKDEG